MGFYSTSFVKRHPALTTSATVVLAVAAVFVIRGGTNDDHIDEWQRADVAGTHTGAIVAYMTSSGSLTMSGALTVEGAMSGANLSVLTGITLGDADGVGCTAIHVKDGVISAQVATCP